MQANSKKQAGRFPISMMLSAQKRLEQLKNISLL
jgi:hypothetical protein